MHKEVNKINKTTQVEIKRYSNGMVKSKTSYVNGKQHGLQTLWKDSGNKATQSMWRRDKTHGLETALHEDGTKWWEVIWVENKEHGLETGWHTDGRKRWEVYYLHGKKSAHIEWDKEGNMITVKLPPNPAKTAKLESITKRRKIISRG